MDWGTVLNAGIKGYSIYDQQRQQKKYIDSLRKMEQQQIDYARQQNDAQFEAQVQALMQSGGGGGGGGGGGAPRMNSAMLQEWRNYMNKAEEMYKPYAEAAKTLLPAKTEAMQTGLGLASQLAKAYSTPEMLTQRSTPAYSIGFNFKR